MNKPRDPNDPEVMPRDAEPRVDVGTMLQISRAEIDGQIATAKAYPRSVATFVREARELVAMDEDTAESCIYSLPRGKEPNGTQKFITGPSARFAEIICHSWGNNRAGGRVTEIGAATITAQGVFHDLEKNTMITKEVSRSILDKYGKRFNADMINVTGNAGISIGLRNAILAGIPQALWLPIYEAARMAAVGDVTTLVARRGAALAWFAKVGVTPEQIFAKLGVAGVEDIGVEQLETLVGIKTAIRRGDYTPERAFADDKPETSAKVTGLADRMKKKPDPEPAKTEPKAETRKPTHTAKELRGLLHLAETLEQINALEPAIAAIPDDDERKDLEVLRDSRTLAVQ